MSKQKMSKTGVLFATAGILLLGLDRMFVFAAGDTYNLTMTFVFVAAAFFVLIGAVLIIKGQLY